MNEHYFGAETGSPDQRRDVTAQIWGREYTFTTSRGVFAREGLDKATAILLERSDPPREAESVLDLGCGWGPIACALAVECPNAVIHAVDTNRRALELVGVNASRLDLGSRVQAYEPDEVPATTYDEIWSNPPIRVGKPALHALLLRWLPRLRPDGTARFVVGKHLGADSLQRWLTEQGYPAERTASAKGFRVLTVRAG